MLNNKVFKQLAKTRKEHCVSMYVPAHPSEDGIESRSFFKRMISDVKEELVERGMDEKAAHKFLFNAYELLEEPEYWSNMQYGLGVFITEDSFDFLKIPGEVGLYFFVGGRFYLRPLLPAVNGKERFYLLAISEDNVNLYEGDKFTLRPIPPSELLPDNMQEAIAAETEERNVQMKSGQSAYETPVFKGSEDMGSGHNLKQWKRYFYQIDEGVRELIDQERTPLVIAAPDPMAPVYKETSQYLDITPVHISGNPDDKDESELHEKAVEILDNFYEGKRVAKSKSFDDYMKDDRASATVFDILSKSLKGEVETLFIAKGRHSWGEYDAEKGNIDMYKEQKPGAIDLLDLAATHTHLNNGDIYFVPKDEMPQPSANANAIFKE